MRVFIVSLLALSFLCFTKNGSSQVSIQTGPVSLEIKTVDENGVAINGTSKNAEVVIDANQNISTLTFDPAEIVTDNIDFNTAIEVAQYEEFKVEMVLDPFQLNAISLSKTPTTVTCVATINGIVEKLPILLTSSVQIGSTSQSYLVTGTGIIPIELFELKDKLTMLKEDIQFRFTQNITVSAR